MMDIRSRTILMAVMMCLSTVASHAQNENVLWNTERLQEVKANPEKYRNLITESRKKADRYLSTGPLVVTDKPRTFVRDTHNYASLAVYYWPDTRNPKSKYVRKDGQVNPEYKQYDGGKLEQLTDRLKYLAIAYYLTEDEKYLSTYLDQLDAWFINKSTYMYPNFEYAQIAPGHNGNKGRPYGLIEAYNFNAITESIRLVNSIHDIGNQREKALREWFRNFAEWMEKSDLGKEERATVNNHGLAYDVLLLNLKLFGTSELDDAIIDEFTDNRLKKHIMADGRQPQELERTRAMHYSVYNLSHIVDFCKILERNGIDYLEENQSLIESAFSYLLQYADNPTKFPHKEISDSWDTEIRWLLREYNRLPADARTDRQHTYDYFTSVSDLIY